MKSKGENAFFFLFEFQSLLLFIDLFIDWTIIDLFIDWAVDLRAVVHTGNQIVTFILSNLCMINFFWFFMCE